MSLPLHMQSLKKMIIEKNLSYSEVSDGSGVSKSAVCDYMNGNRDSSAGLYFAMLEFVEKHPGNPKKARQLIPEIKELRAQGIKCTEIAKRLNISYHTLQSMLYGKYKVIE